MRRAIIAMLMSAGIVVTVSAFAGPAQAYARVTIMSEKDWQNFVSACNARGGTPILFVGENTAICMMP
jgi:ABC-type nickel/cobalt efflux system permease component RcnA